MVGLDFILLANHVEVVNNLLYMVGGGWTELGRPILADGGVPPTHLGVAVSLSIPWEETNRPHTLEVRFGAEQGPDLGIVQAQVNVGRPPTLTEGALQHALAGFSLEIPFPNTGKYRVVARLDENPDESTWKVWEFQVKDIPRGG